MRCQRCGFELPVGSIDCQRCEKQQKVWNSALPSSVSYFLCFIFNAAGLILTLLIFRAFSDPFEVIVIAILTIIYLTVKGAAGMNTLSLAELAKLSYRKFLTGRDGDGHADHAQDVSHAETQHTRAKVKMYINASFDALLYVLALFNLVAALYQ